MLLYVQRVRNFSTKITKTAKKVESEAANAHIKARIKL